MPASNHPVETFSTCRPLLRSTVGPHATQTSTARKRTLAQARMRRILEHSDVGGLECGLAGELSRAERAGVGTAQADDDGLRVTIEADAGPDFVAAFTDRQPFVAADAQPAAIIEHGIDDRLGDL